jgi:hypothetical protein
MSYREFRKHEKSSKTLKVDLFWLFLFIYSHVHTLFGSFLHPAPLPHPLPHLLPGKSYSALITNFVEEKR